MKQIRLLLKMIGITALLALAVGCATTQTGTENRESMLVASGFKAVTPKTAAQQQKLQKLPPGKVTMINKAGKTYYIFPDPSRSLAYVGGPKQYQEYQQLRMEKKFAKEDLETAQMYQDSEMDWSGWGGWGGAGWGPMGMGPGMAIGTY